MPSAGPLLRCSAFGLLVLVMPTVAWAQRSTLGPSLTLMVGGGDGVVARGCQDHHIGALGLQFSRPIAGRLITLQLAGRGFWLSLPASCVEAPLPPPPDGTYIVDERVSLQALPFVATDARIGINAPNNAAMLTLGGGTAWREGHNAPYFVTGIGIPFVDGVTRRFALEVEYHWFRLTSDRFQRTFLNGQMTAELPLGNVHRWSHAVTIGMRFGVPIRR